MSLGRDRFFDESVLGLLVMLGDVVASALVGAFALRRWHFFSFCTSFSCSSSCSAWKVGGRRLHFRFALMMTLSAASAIYLSSVLSTITSSFKSSL